MSEPSKNERATLKDVINYVPDAYLSDDEMALIRSTFKDPRVLKVLRKVLVPTISDTELPIEQFGNDFFGSGREWAQIPADEAKILFVARQDALQFIIGGLIKLRVMANQSVVSPIQNPKDSNK